MAAYNDITGAPMVSKFGSEEAQKNYSDNWDRIFGKKNKEQPPEKEACSCPTWVLGCCGAIPQQEEADSSSPTPANPSP